jgi:hypothetical protein
LLGCEVDARRTRYLRARLRLAHLPYFKTFDQFDFGFQPSIDERVSFLRLAGVEIEGFTTAGGRKVKETCVELDRPRGPGYGD